MEKKKWFLVCCELSKNVRVYAEDEDSAKEKAEKKLGPMWMANEAWEE